MEGLPFSVGLPNPSSSPYGVGFRFVPTDLELLHYLHSKIVIADYYHRLIMTVDMYKHEPWFLPWDPADNLLFYGDERYFFVKTKPLSGSGKGSRPKRTIDSGEGWWEANTRDKSIYDEGGIAVVGYVKSLTFYLKDETKKRKGSSRKEEGIKTDWIMHEYILHRRNAGQWVLCRIHYHGKTPLSFSPPQSLQCPEEPDTIQRPTQTTQQSNGGPDPMQPPPSKRLKSRLQELEPQPLEVQHPLQELQQQQGENYSYVVLTEVEPRPFQVEQESQQKQEENSEIVVNPCCPFGLDFSPRPPLPATTPQGKETAGVDGDADEDLASSLVSFLYDDRFED